MPADRLNVYRAELHIHTLLSPCAEVEMIPPLIVETALERNIDLIAITDHNTTGNVAAVQKAARNTGLVVLPGMELQTREEVHLLCLFDTLDQAFEWQQQVDKVMPPIKNRPEYFGEQYIVDETGEFIRNEEQMLLTSSDFSFSEAIRKVTALGGLAIPAHVERKTFGLLETLGMVPTDVPIEVLEISRHTHPKDAPKLYPQVSGYTLVQGGDAHRLDEMLGANKFTIKSRNLAEIRLALGNRAGRKLEYQ